jgi:hypothetical protein
LPFSSADTNGFVAWGMQTGLGSPQTALPKFRYSRYLSGSDFQVNADVTDIREGGGGLDWSTSFKTAERGQGQLVMNGRPETIAQLFQIMPGGATWDGGSQPPQHTFHTNHASFPYSTVAIGYPATSLISFMSDVKFTSLQIKSDLGNPIMITAPFTAINVGASFNVAFSPTYEAEGLWQFQGASVLLGGNVATTIESWQIDFNLGTEELPGQNLQPADVSIMNRDGSFQLTRRYEDAQLWKYIYYGATGGVAPTTTLATSSFDFTAAYGAGAALRSVRLVVPLIGLRQDALTALDPDGKTVRETISGKIFAHSSGAFWSVVKNAHASAYVG